MHNTTSIDTQTMEKTLQYKLQHLLNFFLYFKCYKYPGHYSGDPQNSPPRPLVKDPKDLSAFNFTNFVVSIYLNRQYSKIGLPKYS